MGNGNTILREANDKLVLLKSEQQQYHEGSFEWADIQSKIDQIVAERYLEYVNR